MKTLFVIWMILTVLLVLSGIGLLLIAPTTYLNAPNDPSTWMRIGESLYRNCRNK